MTACGLVHLALFKTPTLFFVSSQISTNIRTANPCLYADYNTAEIISYGIGHMHGTSGYSGWRWVLPFPSISSPFKNTAKQFVDLHHRRLRNDFPRSARIPPHRQLPRQSQIHHRSRAHHRHGSPKRRPRRRRRRPHHRPQSPQPHERLENVVPFIRLHLQYSPLLRHELLYQCHSQGIRV